jgi:outer membrane protein assembly factor BamE (lipoprotein component of BamABCDE complex)
MVARSASGGFGMLASVTLCACIALPIPGENARGRSSLDKDAVSSLQAGVSTREDVLLALGEPGAFSDDGSWFSYVSLYNEGSWVLLFPDPRLTLMFMDPEFGFSADRIQYQALRVFFDRGGRVRELLTEGGTCGLPCLELYQGSSSDKLLHLVLYERSKSFLEQGEVIHDYFVAAALRSDELWLPGAIVVTNRALLFLELGETGLLFQNALRLPAFAIASVDWGADHGGASRELTARVTRADGSQVVFGFRHLPSDVLREAPTFDAERTHRFIETVLLLRSGSKP